MIQTIYGLLCELRNFLIFLAPPLCRYSDRCTGNVFMLFFYFRIKFSLYTQGFSTTLSLRLFLSLLALFLPHFFSAPFLLFIVFFFSHTWNMNSIRMHPKLSFVPHFQLRNDKFTECILACKYNIKFAAIIRINCDEGRTIGHEHG